jgi:predicted enzyme related to lactoylglutathione lyase
MSRFVRFELRTTDVPAAGAFYASVLGQPVVSIRSLSEQARTRGAPAHWLGFIGVGEVEQSIEAFARRAATQISAAGQTGEGAAAAILRDPGGAFVGLTGEAPPAHVSWPEVAWHDLYTTNVEQAVNAYCGAFGWRLLSQHNLGKQGVHQEFCWDGPSASAGSIVDVATLPGVRPHWLFYFRVPALAPALASVVAGGGAVIAEPKLPNGRGSAICEDPQGGAFALCEDSRVGAG